MITTAQIKGFSEAAQSLKLYRRAELLNDSDELVIEELYVDPLQSNGVLETMLRPNTTFVVGRKGTGKSTVFQRAQHEVRKRKNTLSAYIDIKTVYESAIVDPDVTQKLSSLGAALPDGAIQKVVLYRSFSRAVFQDIQKELRDQISKSLLERFKETVSARRTELISAIDELLEGSFEAEVTDITAGFSTAVQSTVQGRENAKSSGNASTKVALSSKDLSLDVNSSAGWEHGSEYSASEANQFSQILFRTFSVNTIMERLARVLNDAGIRHLYIFVDDFSELPREAMMVFVDTILAPLNNWSNELIKFKVAAYPSRIYLGAIDPTKIDEVYLDTYRLYGQGDVSTMEDKAIDFTVRLLNSRFRHFLDQDIADFCDGDASEVCRQFFYASMGNPRVLGHLLHNLSESHISYGRLVTVRAIQEAASRYYEEKIEPFFGIRKFVHESFEERSSIFSLKELMESLASRARELRDYKGSAVTREIEGRTPSSHFHVLADLESLLLTLELNFFVSKYFEMKDRDGRKVSVYALNYGLCAKHSLSFGRPTGKREHRLYFVERIFDYSSTLKKYLQKNQEIRCDECDAVHDLEKLDGIRLFDMMCPTCKAGTCVVTNLSRKYEKILRDMDDKLLLPPMELGILETLYMDTKGLPALEIATELDCSYQLIGKRGKIMAERGLVDRDTFEKGRRWFRITDKAVDDYFESNNDRTLDLGRD